MTTSVGSEARIRVAVSGAAGRMGSVTCQAVTADADLYLAAAIDPAYASEGAQGQEGGLTDPEHFADLASALEGADIQVVVEFSIPTTVRQNVLACLRRKVPVVVGTTGLGAADLAEIEHETRAERCAGFGGAQFRHGGGAHDAVRAQGGRATGSL